MTDDTNPRWKVDVTPTSETCFYDEEGVHTRDDHVTAMYDCPGGAFEPEEERAVFCTFIIVNDQVTHKVQWSKQNNTQEEAFYTVVVNPCTRLPDWAIQSIIEDYNAINQRTFHLPEALATPQDPNASRETLDRQAKEDFLPHPDEWLTRKIFEKLFQTSEHVQHLQPH